MRRIGNPDRIVIIGGGISGLSSAFYLQREAERLGKEIEITIVDGAPAFGGKINTLQRDGFVIEKGPDSFLARKLAIIDLATELGLENELTTTNPGAKKTYILHKRKLFPMPPGLVLGVPTEIGPFLKTGLLTWGGKLRALLDLTIPARKEQGDESLGGFLERRVGNQVMRRIAEPLLAGIYAGDLKKLSLQATFPQFAASERKHGSLIRGMQHNRKASAAAAALPAVAKGGVFLTFKGGLSTLVHALDEALSDVQRRLEVKVAEIRKAGVIEGEAERSPDAIEHSSAQYEVVLANGERLPADRIVMTAPAYNAADLLEPLTDCRELRAINYVSVANVVMAFDKATFGLDFDGSGFLVPRSEGLHITACTWTSSKWLHTSPDDKVLLRCYVGRAGDEESVKLSDADLIKAVRRDIEETMGIRVEPIFTEITRLNHSMPQYPVGHIENVKRLRARLEQELPGIWITGAAFDGVGLPDCIRQGKEAAQAILK
ncbi:oxygen-dependent protoporphyrinogen oxidase [Paenibacillus castaneae]|uniref:protoporphyrinogen oxidase n=1 Tax=Paenibacillus castaneae TaxID=474957 RepID=UPI000C9C4292|nr:protoporphyrinogen oxidase [Paenibacillus castaneae]NIK77304.1 oxygen-dependent protoporphyrinogen oxidase [Paenibacillus castaneae]